MDHEIALLITGALVVGSCQTWPRSGDGLSGLGSGRQYWSALLLRLYHLTARAADQIPRGRDSTSAQRGLQEQAEGVLERQAEHWGGAYYA